MGVVQVELELGFEGVIWVNEPVLLGEASPNRTGDLSCAKGAVNSLTTLVTDTTIDNWDEFEGDPEEYQWTFAQPTTQLPSIAIKASKANNIQAKQTN